MFGESAALPTERAGFWIRLGAALIDGIVVVIIGLVLAGILGGFGRGLNLLVGLAYTVGFFGSPRGQTPGFMATGIRVVSLDDGGPIGYGRAAVRWLVGLVSAVVVVLGYLWMIWDPEKQTWHDKAAGSVVVPAR